MAREISGWAHVTYEKFWKCRVDFKYKMEYIIAVQERPRVTDSMTGGAWQVSHTCPLEMGKIHVL